MNFDLLIENLSNPALLFFILGIIAVLLKSDLEIPPTSAKFISLYLLFSIGFKGGKELSHSDFTLEIAWALIFGLIIAIIIPVYSFFLLKKRLGIYNAGAIAAAYGSVSAVTFVTAASYLEFQQINFDGHMVAVMALMEAPSIAIAVLLMGWYVKEGTHSVSFPQILKHSFTNGSVLLIIGSLIIGYIASDAQAEGIKPFTTDIFKGFLAVFLLDMGISSGKKISAFVKYGWYPILYSIIIPLINGCIIAIVSQFVTADIGNRFMFAVLAASASYIAVPAAMRLAAPKADSGLYVPMALAVTFPINITIGMPIYLTIVNAF
jgi:uncharacterized protein